MSAILQFTDYLRLPIVAIVCVCLTLKLVHILWYHYVVSTGRDPNCKAPLPPGGMGWPIIGESFYVLIRGSKFYSDSFRRFGTRMFKTHLFGSPTIRIYGAENLHTILHGEHNLVESSWPKSTQALLGNVLTLSSGDRHTILRRHVSRAFTHDALEGYVHLALPSIQDGVDSWSREESVLAFDVTRRLFFEIASVVLCGFDRREIEGEVMATAFMDFTRGFFTLPFDLPGTPYRKALTARKTLLKNLDKVVNKKLKLSPEEDKRDALRILMEHDEDMEGHVSTESLKADMLDLLNAGFNTTSSAATTLLYHISKKPELLKRIRRELAELRLLERSNGLTFDRLTECKYLTNVVKEGLRMGPPIGGGFRKVLKTFELEGYQIPKGWTIIYSIRDTIELSEGYSNKDQFNPDRFNPDRQEDQKGGRYNYPIFGGGSRSCMGKQFAQLILKILLVELARTCSVEPLYKEPVKFRAMPIPHPVEDLPLRFKKLDPSDIVKDAMSTV